MATMGRRVQGGESQTVKLRPESSTESRQRTAERDRERQSLGSVNENTQESNAVLLRCIERSIADRVQCLLELTY